MENQNENQLSLENAEVGLDLPGFELDERFDVGFDRLFPGRQDTVRTFSRRRPELERRDAANSLWAFGWRGSIITICNNRFSEQTS
jgi:hypothetical protein